MPPSATKIRIPISQPYPLSSFLVSFAIQFPRQQYSPRSVNSAVPLHSSVPELHIFPLSSAQDKLESWKSEILLPTGRIKKSKGKNRVFDSLF